MNNYFTVVVVLFTSSMQDKTAKFLSRDITAKTAYIVMFPLFLILNFQDLSNAQF